jgi:membrane-associated phospholipid phosphatase
MNAHDPSAPRPWRRIIALAVLAAALTAGAFALDAPVRSAILQHQGKGWKKSAEFRMQSAVSKYGDWPQLMILGLAGLGVARLSRSRRWQQILVSAMIASTLAGLLANASRLTTGRPRPREIPKIEAGWYGPYHDGKILIGNSRYNAFPSGHTATAVGFAAVILFASPLWGVFAMLAAFAIAWSRMSLGAHHFSDVVVATLLAMTVAWVVLGYVRLHGDQTAERLARWVRIRLEKWKNRPQS